MSNELKQYVLQDDSVTNINYPVTTYPKKINSLSLIKNASFEGELEGIKGQYLLLDNGRVFNVRSHQGFIIDFLF